MSDSPLTYLAGKVQQANVPWGLTIYRTTYTPFSDTHFAEVVDLITALAKYSVRKWKTGHPDDAAKLAAKSVLQETFEPIIMNDKSEFDGMTLEAIRERHQALIERPVGKRSITHPWLCLLVDEEVVQVLAGADPEALIATQDVVRDYSKYWVKAVETDTDDEDDKGWMKCSVYALWNLWDDMEGQVPMSGWEALYPDGPYCG
ncbi:hypothetical protein BJY04DRAFT_201276 [Aspergillus karnatakaensis]|uniref:uncharacterized protein n=1 Tax=Aspergillus karnatakaensis TaxID=1810916 RepID=UPI003CCE1114